MGDTVTNENGARFREVGIQEPSQQGQGLVHARSTIRTGPRRSALVRIMSGDLPLQQLLAILTDDLGQMQHTMLNLSITPNPENSVLTCTTSMSSVVCRHRTIGIVAPVISPISSGPLRVLIMLLTSCTASPAMRTPWTSVFVSIMTPSRGERSVTNAAMTGGGDEETIISKSSSTMAVATGSVHQPRVELGRD